MSPLIGSLLATSLLLLLTCAAPRIHQTATVAPKPDRDPALLAELNALNLKARCQREGVKGPLVSRADSLISEARQNGSRNTPFADLALELAATLYDLALTKSRLVGADQEVASLRRAIRNYEEMITELETRGKDMLSTVPRR